MKPHQPLLHILELAHALAVCCILPGSFLIFSSIARAQARPDEFNPGVSGRIEAIAVQPDGRILLGGDFANVAGQTRYGLARVNYDGSLDPSFDPQTTDRTTCLAMLPDSRILAGTLTWIGQWGYAAKLRRYNLNGTLDGSFSGGPSSLNITDTYVFVLAVQADSNILVGGNFTRLSEKLCFGLGRIHPDGSPDTTFNSSANGPASALALQPDGKILVFGLFRLSDDRAFKSLWRLNLDGGFDAGFNIDTNEPSISSVLVQPDGKILVAGYFQSLAGQPRHNIGRLNSDGTLDAAFGPDPDSTVRSMALQADGKIVIGGAFTRLGSQGRNHIARLNADGTVDASFDVGANGQVTFVGLQPDGKILLTGLFSALDGQPYNQIGRLNNNEPASQNLSSDGSTVTWLRGGSSPEIWRVTFEFSINGTDWLSLGAGTRIPGGWWLQGIAAPRNSTIRARGFVIGAQWFVETVFPRVQPAILVNDASFGFHSNQFGFNLAGSAGQPLAVEASTNLQDWMPLATNTLGSVPVHFSDPSASNFLRRFYRARAQ